MRYIVQEGIIDKVLNFKMIQEYGKDRYVKGT